MNARCTAAAERRCSFSQHAALSPLLQALRFVRRLLQYPPPDQPKEYLSLARLVIQVAYAAVAFSEQAVCVALDALSAMQSPGALRPCCSSELQDEAGAHPSTASSCSQVDILVDDSHKPAARDLRSWLPPSLACRSLDFSVVVQGWNRRLLCFTAS